MDTKNPADIAFVVGLMLGIPAIVGFSIWGLTKLARNALTTSRPFVLALEQLQASQAAHATLGSPIETEPPLSGNYNNGLLGGWAQFDIPVSGIRRGAP